MNPIEPSSEPLDLTPAPMPQPPPATPPREPFFDYADLFLFIAAAVPCLLLAVLLVRAARIVSPASASVEVLVVQTVWYFLIFGALAALFRIRYHRPFWRSLGWRPITFLTAAGAILAGPLLAIGIGLVGSAMRTPEINLPFEQMLGSRATVAFLGVVVVILGPLCEELAFRGLMMPLLIRSFGAAGGIVLTGVIFGCVHGYEYEWSWRHMLLISAAGCIFGWAKYKTQSTVTSAFMHATFNLTQFVAFLVQSRTI